MSAVPRPEVTDDDWALLIYLATFRAQKRRSPFHWEIARDRGLPLPSIPERISGLVAAGVLRHDHGIRRGLALAPVGYLPAVEK